MIRLAGELLSWDNEQLQQTIDNIAVTWDAPSPSPSPAPRACRPFPLWPMRLRR
jgi:hypothetical protein